MVFVFDPSGNELVSFVFTFTFLSAPYMIWVLSEIWQAGREVVVYMGPSPPEGEHRYVFLLFKHQVLCFFAANDIFIFVFKGALI